MPVDFKKQDKALYAPTTKPVVVEVPAMGFIMVEGRGDPNSAPAYLEAIEILYGLSYTIKMSKDRAEGYFEYVVPPLEGLWWFEEGEFSVGAVIDHKDEFCWKAMIRQPDFVTDAVVEQAKLLVAKKKGLDATKARFEIFTEGLCAQILHLGSYDDEPATIFTLDEFIAEQGYQTEMSGWRQHHEIYLSDPRRTEPEKLKTIIRHPIVAL